MPTSSYSYHLLVSPELVRISIENLEQENKLRSTLNRADQSAIGRMQVPPNPLYLMAQAMHSITYGDVWIKCQMKVEDNKKVISCGTCMSYA